MVRNNKNVAIVDKEFDDSNPISKLTLNIGPLPITLAFCIKNFDFLIHLLINELKSGYRVSVNVV
jgi:hypothetical protein